MTIYYFVRPDSGEVIIQLDQDTAEDQLSVAVRLSDRYENLERALRALDVASRKRAL